MRFLYQNKQRPKQITRIIIEPKDLEVEGMGVEIQVEGYKGSPEELDASNTHVYIEKWEGQAQIVVWNQQSDPDIFKLKESEE